MVEVKRKKGESFEGFLRRFNKVLIRSGQLIQARKIRFRQRKKSQLQVKSTALRRIDFLEKRSYLERIGKLPAEEQRSNHRRS